MPPANTGVSEPEPSVWYGWQVMISDGLAAATLAFAGDDEEWLTASLAIYGLGGPLVHTGNLQGWRALGSLGLRTAGTALAAATFMDVGCGEVRHENEPPTYDCTGCFREWSSDAEALRWAQFSCSERQFQPGTPGLSFISGAHSERIRV